MTAEEMNPTETKAEMRQASLMRRDAIQIEQRLEKSLAMSSYAGNAIQPYPGVILSGFFPIRSEPDIRPLMSQMKAHGARLCLPVVIDRETIVFRELVPGAELVDTGFGTRGPGPDAAVLDPDIMLLPLAAFDGEGNRIGYGAGHYDRAIARLHRKSRRPRLIGIAFDCQEVPQVPFEPHDVALDSVVTESGYRQFR